MIRRRPAAIEAIIEQADYIGQDSPASAERFIDAVEATLAELSELPQLGRVYESSNPSLAGLRCRLVKGFPNHIVFYRPTGTDIEFVLMLHAARDLDVALDDEA